MRMLQRVFLLHESRRLRRDLRTVVPQFLAAMIRPHISCTGVARHRLGRLFAICSM